MTLSRFILVIIDGISFATAFLLAFVIRQSASIFTYRVDDYALLFVLGCLLLYLIYGVFGLYRMRPIEISVPIASLIKAGLIWSLAFASVVFALKYDFSRTVFLFTILETIMFIMCARFVYFRSYRLKLKNNPRDVHVVGTGERAESVSRELSLADMGYKIKLHDLRLNRAEVLTMLASLPKNEIIVADERLGREEVMNLLVDDKLGHHNFRVVLDTFKLITGEIRFNELSGIPSLTPNRDPHSLYLYLKRALDLVLSTLGIIISLPLCVLIYISIKLDSHGPAIIRQERIGWNNRPFVMYKFRTMQTIASLYEIAPLHENDARITRVGRILRRFSLDELPQLLNIFLGEMTFVGPRPEMAFIVEKYVPWQMLRLKAKPGLTGLWQILGRKEIPLYENLEYDFYYVSNMSLLLDGAILVRTIPSVLFGRGAY
jgi:exopolysaccharide biosynthesis polyprenyl glycosylphosphotransferase